MKKACCSISILFYLLQTTVCAQELHVYFDAHSKEVTYMMGGDTIHKPKARKGEQIVFHLQNFNNFLYEARVEGGKEDVQVSSGNGGSGQLMPGLGSGSMSLFAGLVPFSGAAGTGLETTKDIGFGGSGFGADAEVMSQLNQLKISYDAALSEMFRTEKKLNFIQEDLDNYVEAKAVNRIVLAELARLKRNDRLQPQQIKSLSLEYLEKIFRTESASDITLSGLLEKSDAKAELRGYQQKLEEEAGEYDRSRNKVASIVAQLALFQIKDKEFGTWKNSAAEVLAQSEKIQQTIAENKSRLQQFVAEAKNDDIQRLAALRYEYEAIAANDFSETFRMDADGDHTLIKVRLLPKDSTGRTDPQAAVEFPPLKIPVFGGLKINTSIGLSFGKFFDQPYSYFVKDSLIARQEMDQFTPMLTSFFHFYPQSNGQVSVGGSFGIGLPIAGNDGQQSISFFLGPSLIIGKGERIVVSTGLMGGRKEKLANAYLVGDSFSSEIDNVPTYSRYEMGFYFGLSFNLISSK
ncbi:MAG: hypothetical protein R2788_26125 [Saprospiraceae bacterium]